MKTAVAQELAVYVAWNENEQSALGNEYGVITFRSQELARLFLKSATGLPGSGPYSIQRARVVIELKGTEGGEKNG